jgi:hypothetical protein
LNPELDPEWEEEQDFIETTGIRRVVQAMHAHLWPNLQMKGKETFGLHVYYTWSGYKITGLIFCQLPVAFVTVSGVAY